MNENEDIRWKQRFQNYEKSFLLLKRTLGITNPSEAEKVVKSIKDSYYPLLNDLYTRFKKEV